MSDIGWGRFLVIDYPAYKELCYEFYATFQFDKSDSMALDTPGVIKYRLQGTPQEHYINEFNLILGFVGEDTLSSGSCINSACDYIQLFASNYIEIRREWSTDKQLYDPSQSKAAYLKDPMLKVNHRFLAYNFSGRKDSSGTLAKAEFYFLWCMCNKVQVNFGYWVASQLQSVLSKRHKHSIMGPLITHLAVRLGVLDRDKE